MTVLLAAVLGLSAGTAVYAQDGPDFTEEEREYIANAPVLRVGYVQDRIPVSFRGENGELAGISRSIFDRIAELCGLSFEYVPLPGGSVTYSYLMEEKLDLVTSVEYNQENVSANGILISDPYLSSRKVIVARAGESFSYDAPRTVAISSGSQTIRKVMRETFPQYTIQDYETIGDCFSAVKRGDADLLMLNQYVVEYWLYKPLYENLKVIPVLGLDDQLCFSAVVAFDENGDPIGEEGYTLISILNKAIAMLEEDEVDSFTIQAIMENRYTYTVGDFLYRYRYALAALTVSGVLILLLAVLLIRQQLQSAQARADARAQSRFLSTMSHEIRTPLNGLIGLNYLMSFRMDDKKQMARYLNQSTMTAKYLLSLVNDILEMSMLQKRDVKIDQKPVDLGVLISTVEAIVRKGMEDKKLDFRVEDSLSHPVVIGDSVRIQQVLLNLLDNARKFTQECGRVTVRVRQEEVPGGKIRTVMEVADNGKGMSRAFQKNIFDSFSQERDSVSSGDQGVGLGLSICHRLVQLMDGELHFVSEPNQGSVFTFSFDAQAAAPDAVMGDAAFAESEKRPKVLLAEDNGLNAEIMTELLQETGYEVDLAENGARAVEMFGASAEGTYGIILMDLLMPQMDGYEAARAIRGMARADAGTVRIIACSANCTQEDQKKARESGMDDFLSKPVDMEELLRKLNG